MSWRMAPIAARSPARMVFLAFVCGAAALSSPAWADDVGGEPIVVPSENEEPADTPEPSLDGWQFEVAPYAWFIFLHGSITALDTEDPVLLDLKFDEIWKQLHMAFFLDVDVRKDDIGFYGDLFYSKLWSRGEGTPILPSTFKNDIDIVIFDFGLYYEILNIGLGSGPSAPRLRLQPLFGGRYLYIGLTVRRDSPLPPPLGGTSFHHPALNTAAPVLGMRGFIDFNDRWNISFVGDGGGFGVDGMEKTWQAELLGGYRFHPRSKIDLNLMIGYKAVGIESSGDTINADFTLHGPVLKLGFEF
jgi:hypothetical protein